MSLKDKIEASEEALLACINQNLSAMLKPGGDQPLRSEAALTVMACTLLLNIKRGDDV